MNSRIDLTPPACRQRIVRKSVTRRWVLSYACVAVAIVVILLPLRIGVVAKRSHLSWLQREAALDADFERQLNEMQDKMDRLVAIAARYESVAWPIDLSDVIAVIADVMPRSVTLTSLTITPRMQRERGADAARSPSSVVLELAGIAPTDLDVATLLAGFESHHLFDRVSIDHSRPTTIRGVESREFGATCEIELASRRVTTVAGAEGGKRR
ncbi:MAG: hypothetical protein EA379_08560 [Phycisphaerales bacterium]|nr:MAG: hypothetical protein EA379_08560 [Phycisphaerales bacterium]